MGYRDIFKSKHTFLAVIHSESAEQSLRNTEIAKANGADGVFLINHKMSADDLFSVYRAVREAYPDFWIGLNCLDLSPLRMFRVVSGCVSGVWSDNAGFGELENDPLLAVKLSWKAREERSDWNGLYFGGVAFKYQKNVYDATYVAWLVMPYLDVVTTSGDATGSPPLVSKIKRMKKAIGDFPLAIASGMAPENVSEFMPHADCFFVATGISKSFTELDAERVSRFAKAIQKK